LRKKYGNLERLDRILKANGDSPDKYKVAKQADVCMLFYVLTSHELRTIFRSLDYPFPDDIIQRNIYYYLPRTSHGSTLSKLVFSSILQPYDRSFAWDMFVQALRSDIDDSQQGTTGEGIHMAVMAGTLNTLTCRYAGIDTSRDTLHIKPHLPPAIESVSFKMQFRGVYVDVLVEHRKVIISTYAPKLTVFVRGVMSVAGYGKPAALMLEKEKTRIKTPPSVPVAEAVQAKKKLKLICKGCGTDFSADGHQVCALCGSKVCARCYMGRLSFAVSGNLHPTSLQVCEACYANVEQHPTLEGLLVQKEGHFQGEKRRNKAIPKIGSFEQRELEFQKELVRLGPKAGDTCSPSE